MLQFFSEADPILPKKDDTADTDCIGASLVAEYYIRANIARISKR